MHLTAFTVISKKLSLYDTGQKPSMETNSLPYLHAHIRRKMADLL